MPNVLHQKRLYQKHLEQVLAWVYWKDIEIINMKSGQPKVELRGNAKNILMEMVPENKEYQYIYFYYR